MVQAVILDCDGTLVDSERLSLQVLVDYAAELGASVSHEEAMRSFAGVNLQVVFAEISKRSQRPLPEDYLGVFRARQMETLAKDLQPMPGARELLDSLRVPYCVASNAPRRKIAFCLEATGLDSYFDASRIYSAYDIEAWKPDPALFVAAAAGLGAAAADCVVVEDSTPGIEAGVAAGMSVLALDPPDKLQAESPNVRRFKTLVEVREALRAKAP